MRISQNTVNITVILLLTPRVRISKPSLKGKKRLRCLQIMNENWLSCTHRKNIGGRESYLESKNITLCDLNRTQAL